MSGLVKPEDETVAQIQSGGGDLSAFKQATPPIDETTAYIKKKYEDNTLTFGEEDDSIDTSGRYWNILIDGYLYKFNVSDYKDYRQAIREAASLMNYDTDFRSWFSENLDDYVNQRNDGAFVITAGWAREDFEKFLVINPSWTPDPYHQQKANEAANYGLETAEAIHYLGQTMHIDIAKAYDELAAIRKQEAENAQALIEQQKLIELNTRKSQESLQEYLVRAFKAPEGTVRSWEDFFTRIMPKLQSTIPAFGTAVAGYTGNSMDAFQYYIFNQQMGNILNAMGLSPYSSKSGKTSSWARPIYNIKNYYPQKVKIQKYRKVRG